MFDSSGDYSGWLTLHPSKPNRVPAYSGLVRPDATAHPTQFRGVAGQSCWPLDECGANRRSRATLNGGRNELKTTTRKPTTHRTRKRASDRGSNPRGTIRVFASVISPGWCSSAIIGPCHGSDVGSNPTPGARQAPRCGGLPSTLLRVAVAHQTVEPSTAGLRLVFPLKTGDGRLNVPPPGSGGWRTGRPPSPRDAGQDAERHH